MSYETLKFPVPTAKFPVSGENFPVFKITGKWRLNDWNGSMNIHKMTLKPEKTREIP
jgi:hypothetical protein